MSDVLEPVDIPVDDTEPCPVNQMTDVIAALMMQRLDWLTRRIKEAEDIARANIAAETARCNDWFIRKTKADREAAEQIQARLEEWMLDVRDATAGKVKSKSFPHGTVQTREVGGGWKPSAETLEWAKANRPELVQVVESFALAKAKRALAATEAGVVDPVTGDLVPGLVVEPKDVKVSVVLGGDS